MTVTESSQPSCRNWMRSMHKALAEQNGYVRRTVAEAPPTLSRMLGIAPQDPYTKTCAMSKTRQLLQILWSELHAGPSSLGIIQNNAHVAFRNATLFESVPKSKVWPSTIPAHYMSPLYASCSCSCCLFKDGSKADCVWQAAWACSKCPAMKLATQGRI